jgi:hypothetical protein
VICRASTDKIALMADIKVVVTGRGNTRKRRLNATRISAK